MLFSAISGTQVLFVHLNERSMAVTLPSLSLPIAKTVSVLGCILRLYDAEECLCFHTCVFIHGKDETLTRSSGGNCFSPWHSPLPFTFCLLHLCLGQLLPLPSICFFQKIQLTFLLSLIFLQIHFLINYLLLWKYLYMCTLLFDIWAFWYFQRQVRIGG